jgi:hypothetical protein
MAKSKNRKNHKQKVEKRNKEIRKAQMKRYETMTHNLDVLMEVMRDYAKEVVDRDEKGDD